MGLRVLYVTRHGDADYVRSRVPGILLTACKPGEEPEGDFARASSR